MSCSLTISLKLFTIVTFRKYLKKINIKTDNAKDVIELTAKDSDAHNVGVSLKEGVNKRLKHASHSMHALVCTYIKILNL